MCNFDLAPAKVRFEVSQAFLEKQVNSQLWPVHLFFSPRRDLPQ
ncbi:MAG TPA: hypothetical protein VK961_05540 [Chthoniobacter sp.]|nr:hypothetical protein [Chthoniobacter sp.]